MSCNLSPNENESERRGIASGEAAGKGTRPHAKHVILAYLFKQANVEGEGGISGSWLFCRVQSSVNSKTNDTLVTWTEAVPILPTVLCG